MKRNENAAWFRQNQAAVIVVNQKKIHKASVKEK